METKNLAQTHQQLPYCGAQALFNRDFIPHRVYNQRRHLDEMDHLLFDSHEDQQPSLSIVTGIKGTGKNLLMNQLKQKCTADIQETLVSVDCENKTLSQILFSLVSKVMTLLHLPLDPALLCMMSAKEYWAHLKRYAVKLESPLTILLNSAEFLDKKCLLKLIDFSHRYGKFNLVLGYNIPGSSLQILDIYQSDYKCNLDKYEQQDLYHITRDRCHQAFDFEISTNTISYVVDMIEEFGQQTPGACINYLKELYPKAMDQHEVEAETCRLISQYCIGQHSFSTLSLADFIVEADMLERLVLDNCISTFKQYDAFYLSFDQLRECYDCGCETLEYDSSAREFYQIVQTFNQNMILLPSPLQLKQTKFNSLEGVFPVDHFLTLPLDEISELLDVCFGSSDFLPF